MTRAPNVMTPAGAVRARKEHRCSRCGRTIRKGEVYYRFQALPFERPDTDCMACVDSSLCEEAETK